MESLLNVDIVNVSCGSFHTLVVEKDGSVYSFGQNKYGKLGLDYYKSSDIKTSLYPSKISMYK